MKSIVLALALTAASDPHSLGIGLDVLPEAFAVAAVRVHAPVALLNPKCGETECRWDYGEGVVVDARLREGTLSIAAIEAISAGGRADLSRFREACRAIVALVRPHEALSLRDVAVESIAAGGEDPRPYDAGVVLYGKRIVRQHGAVDLRCGAAAAE